MLKSKNITITLVLSLMIGLFGFIGKDKNKIVHNPKTGEVLKGDTVLYYMEPIGSIVFGVGNYSVKDISKKEIFLVREVTYKTGQRTYDATLKRDIDVKNSYYQIVFANNNQTAEIEITTNGNLARSFYNEGLIKNGYLDTISQKRYIMLHGNEFSKERDALLGNKVIIIDNNNQTPRNGVNINIGH